MEMVLNMGGLQACLSMAQGKSTNNHSSGSPAYGRQKQQHVLDNRASDKYKDQQIAPDNASLPPDSVEVIYVA
jgi:hypothetical protein